MAENMYAAHQMFLDRGYDNWSEWGYVHNKLGKSLNVSALATEGGGALMIWERVYFDFIIATSLWKTVDQGLNRIAEAFKPLLGNKVQFNTMVSKLAFTDDNKVAVQWKSSPFDPNYQSKTYDRVIVSAPFSVVRTWHLPKMSYTITKAIRTLKFSQACKVALEFKTRFWEYGDRPIFGGCTSTDLASGKACYPPYRHPDGDGRGVMLGNYISGDMALSLSAMNEEDHVALVLDNMVEIHGEQARQQFTGNYQRYCGNLDPYAACSWAAPEPGQHSLFSPSYFQMEQGLVFVGEHTDVKHAWISAALASALRGVVMILVEAGHVDDARKLVRHWDAPWLDI
ncbi:flavin-containing amine oxidoreductase-domain containing protein [Absidia repens]|uniref:Flavin-containing amine oxidoreductase-domain containing protein n=1 Tax=Absidia repens TaxID=90262 RepID=A0A1X2J3S5_9FUNG|nr:flavin-containing amine oxidoreductase-domain containing protein [Absidia repens]